MVRKLKDGIFVPLPCFFLENEEVDYDSYFNHVKNVCKHGIMPVVSGSMGEAIHLDSNERKKLIKITRKALDQMGLYETSIMAGSGGSSTRETIKLSKEAAEAGADYLLVIPPGYYSGAMTDNSLREFYLKVAEESPIPILIYNFPGVSGGINMSSNLIISIAQASKKVVGAKLTCASVSKLGRIAQSTSSFENVTGSPFLTLAGFIDFLLPAMSVGGRGAITGVPNFAPKTCAKLWNLCNSEWNKKNLQEINSLHLLVSRADELASEGNISGMKRLLEHLHGYPGNVRGPLIRAPDHQIQSFLGTGTIQDILKYEKALE